MSETTSVDTLLSQIAHASKDAVTAQHNAVQLTDGNLSYEELFLCSFYVSEFLREQGVQTGERIWIEFENGLEHLVAVLATGLCGGIAFQIARGFKSKQKKNIQNRIRPKLHLGPASSVIDAEVKHVNFSINIKDKTLQFDQSISLPPLLISALKLTSNLVLPNPKSAAYIKLSSGSTGIPKGVVSTHYQQFILNKMLVREFNFGREHKELVISPMAHSGAWQRIAATLCAGGSIAFATEPLLISGLFDEIEEKSITGFFTTPPIARMLLSQAKLNLKEKLSTCLSVEFGSAPLSPTELNDLAVCMPAAKIYFHYGLTECSRAFILPVSDNCKPNSNKLHTVGRPAYGVQVQIRGLNNQVLAANKRGEIFLKAKHLCLEYWDDPELTRKRIKQEWFSTDDFGELDDDGFLLLHGRNDDIINCGGFSYFPTEVEVPLGEIEGVATYIIAGMKDPRGVMGDVPIAIVVVREEVGQEVDQGTTWSSSLLIKTAKQRLPAHMIPRKIIQVPNLILTLSGKIDRKKNFLKYVIESKSE